MAGRHGTVRVVGCGIAALALLTACSHTSGKQTASSTQSSASSSQPTASSSSVVAIDVHSVDWRNVAVPGAACLSSTAITLVNGQALIPDSQHGHPSQPGGTGPSYDKLSEVGSPTFGDFEGPAAPANPDDAAVSLDCDNNGGTAGGALLYSVGLYSVRSGTAKSVGLITPHQQLTGVLPTIIENVTMAPGTITVTEDWYGANDPTCCPTGRATSTWSYAASQLTYGSTRVTAQPH